LTNSITQPDVPTSGAAAASSESDDLLRVENLRVRFSTEEGTLTAINQADLALKRGEALGIVGESGCGKSVLSETILRLIPEPPGRIERGRILFNRPKSGWTDLAAIDPRGRAMRRIRGNEISMIFQETMTSLNPVFTVGGQIAEVLRIHQKLTRKEARERAIDMLREVRIPAPEQRAGEYPHQLSGGMRQRVMIAMALACEPELLIADEPTTAVDVTVQAQILRLIRELQQRHRMSVMFISHDLGVISEVADRVVVMYLGHVVEEASMERLFAEPAHPYTRGLLGCIADEHAERGGLTSIPGQVPVPIDLGDGCPFADRCEHAMDKCRRQMPPWTQLTVEHGVACWLHEDEEAMHETAERDRKHVAAGGDSDG
jgi:oligopeptide/dipeptide ABC transporter ATP-binding protein